MAIGGYLYIYIYIYIYKLNAFKSQQGYEILRNVNHKQGIKFKLHDTNMLSNRI